MGPHLKMTSTPPPPYQNGATESQQRWLHHHHNLNQARACATFVLIEAAPIKPWWRDSRESRAAKRGGFPIWTCPSFFVLFWTFPTFPGFSRFARDGPGIFPIRPFSLSRPIKSTYEEQSRKGPRHNLDLSRKKWETPRFGTPPV